MNLKKALLAGIILTILTTGLISCASTNNSYYRFPTLPESERIVKDKNITVKDKDGNVVFYYDGEKDYVTVPYWYWQKIINYGIDTGGLK